MWEWFLSDNSMKYSIFFVLFLFVSSCKLQEDTNDGKKIVVDQSVSVSILQIEDIADRVEYIPIETNQNYLLDESFMLYVTESYIVAGRYLFDRKTGHFVRIIAVPGEGPDEYTNWPCYSFDEKENILYANKGMSKWLGYDITTGKKVSEIKRPNMQNLHEWCYKDGIHNFHTIDSDKYISFVNNMKGRDSIRIVVFDKSGNVKQTYPNYRFSSISPKQPFLFPGIFYVRNENLFFFEMISDTIYQVKSDSLAPYLFFDSGNKKMTDRERFEFYNHKDKIAFECVFETERYLFFEFSLYNKMSTGYYDKKKKETSVIIPDKASTIYRYGFNDSGLQLYIRGININDELYGYISSEDFNHMIQEIPEYKNQFDVKNDDNPVVFIIHPKR